MSKLLTGVDRHEFESRFFAKIDRSEGDDKCWPWLAAKDRAGYGIFQLKSYTTVKAHRLSLAMYLGRELVSDLQIRHLCGNAGCCNPTHLREGTAAENAADRFAHGNTARHERSGQAVLTAYDVDRIRSLRLGGMPCLALAKMFGVSRTQIYRIVRNEAWTAPKMKAPQIEGLLIAQGWVRR